MSVCTKSISYLLQGDNHEAVETNSSSPLEDITILTCSKPVDRRVTPQHEEPLRCPRCDSNHTKFCYYNNYSLTQPRYFCKTCRRYWTKGGSLRNVPVGGGCRKNKRPISKRSPEQSLIQNLRSSHGVTGFNLISGSYISDLDVYMGQTDFTGVKYNTNLGESRLTDGSEKRRNYFLDGDLGFDYGLLPTSGFQKFYYHPPLGFSMDGSCGSLLENTETVIVAHEAEDHQIETKPDTELLSIEWPEQSYSEIGKNSSEYVNNLGSWSSTLDGYGLL